jgi:hypothetical protein
MIIRLKPLAALVAVTTAFAVALPAVSASAAPVVPTPTSLLCSMLNAQRLAALRSGNLILAGLLAQTMVLMRCGPSPFPYQGVARVNRLA